MDAYVEQSEKDGLVITVDDEASSFLFEWNEETHPQWNFLCDLGEEGISRMLMDRCQRILSEHETKDLHDPESSS
jgi:hypothetical protein